MQRRCMTAWICVRNNVTVVIYISCNEYYMVTYITNTNPFFFPLPETKAWAMEKAIVCSETMTRQLNFHLPGRMGYMLCLQSYLYGPQFLWNNNKYVWCGHWKSCLTPILYLEAYVIIMHEYRLCFCKLNMFLLWKNYSRNVFLHWPRWKYLSVQ